MRLSGLPLVVCTAAVFGFPAPAGSQGAEAARRLTTLANAGSASEARALADSILADTDPSATVYTEALYWRGALGSDASAARLDLLRLIVDHPFSARVPDALYRLAQDEIRDGRTLEARRRLGRIIRDHSGSPIGPTAAWELGRMLMAGGDVRDACVALDSALAHEPAGSVERRNRIAYERRPCDRLPADAAPAVSGVGATEPPVPADTAARSRADTGGAARASASGRSSGSAASPPAPAVRGGTASTGRWSVQVAAFAERGEADRLATTLRGRGYDTRVTSTRPYRVRVGRFATRAEAAIIVARLKNQGTTAIVVEAERP